MKTDFNKYTTQYSGVSATSHGTYSFPSTLDSRISDASHLPPFTGALDGMLTQSLIAIDTNPMVNAALVDVFAMVLPRTYVDTKKRNKYAGTETFLREAMGTFIVCLSSGIFAKGIAHLYNKFVEPEIKINSKSWLTNDSLELLQHSWNKSGGNVEKYVSNILANISGIDGKGKVSWNGIEWKNTDGPGEPAWNKINWKNPEFKNIHERLKSEDEIIKTLSEIIQNKDIDEADAKHILKIIEHRITNVLEASNSITVEFDGKTLGTSLTNLLRDTYDLGRNVFSNKDVNIEKALNKLGKMNKVKTLGALSIAAGLGLTNQYLNRQITKKRTGTTAFVGEVDYKDIIKNKEQQAPKRDKGLFGLKLLASAGIVTLAAIVMKIKNPADFIKKLEFTGPITSGNAIKTVYTTVLVGRFLASDNLTELRESVTRDYLGFLNWLVFGGFVAKGVANLLDRGQNNLFNIHKEGKGLKHWLSDISLKSHAEIAAKGTEFAKKNIWKLNLAHISGLLYSTLALGFFLPILNIAVTKYEHRKHKGEQKNELL